MVLQFSADNGVHGDEAEDARLAHGALLVGVPSD